MAWERLWKIRPILFDQPLIELADEAVREVAGPRTGCRAARCTSRRARAGRGADGDAVRPVAAGLSHTKVEDTREEHLELSVQALDRLASKALAEFA